MVLGLQMDCVREGGLEGGEECSGLVDNDGADGEKDQGVEEVDDSVVEEELTDSEVSIRGTLTLAVNIMSPILTLSSLTRFLN